MRIISFIFLLLVLSTIQSHKLSLRKQRNLKKIMQGLNQQTRFLESSQQQDAKKDEAKKSETDSEKSVEKQEEEAESEKNGSGGGEGTEAYNDLIKKISFYADEFMHGQESPTKRKLKKGVLSLSFPKARRDLLTQEKFEQRKQGKLVKYLHKPERFCYYPYFEINIMGFCDQEFLSKASVKRALECKHLNCVNCCFHIHYVYKFVVMKSIVSEVIGLADDAGFVKIKEYFTRDQIKQCAKTCQKIYHVEMPIIIPPPKKLIDLGKTKEEPAKSCIDIKANGNERANSDVYFIQPAKQPFKIFCDMVTDQGGWGMFYNYLHHPFEQYDIGGDELPIDPIKQNGHMHLHELGFQSFDVLELLFWCTTDHKIDNDDTKNADLMKVALSGDQISMKPKSWTDGFTPLTPDNPQFDNYVNRRITSDMKETPQKSDGGFWNKPFGGLKGYWNIRGSGVFGMWECGDTLTQLDGTKYKTEHRVFFRGMGPEEDFVAKRALSNPGKDESQSKRRRK